MKNSRYNKIILLLMIFTIAFMSIAAVKEYRRLTNLRVKGWLFGDTSWTGLETWAYADSIDTLEISGIDTTCYFLVTAIDVTPKAPLYGIISRNGDTVFVTCDSTLANTNKYNWCVIRP